MIKRVLGLLVGTAAVTVPAALQLWPLCGTAIAAALFAGMYVAPTLRPHRGDPGHNYPSMLFVSLWFGSVAATGGYLLDWPAHVWAGIGISAFGVNLRRAQMRPLPPQFFCGVGLAVFLPLSSYRR